MKNSATTKASATTKVSATETTPAVHTFTTPITHEAISARAKAIWLSRGTPTGCDEEIWLQAEQELVAHQKTADAAKGAKPLPGAGKRVRSNDGNTIDGGALQDSLDSVGELPRSPSAINLT